MLINLDEAGDFRGLLGSLGVPVVLGHLGYPKGGAATWTQTRAFADLLKLVDGGQCWIKLTGPYRITTAPDLPYADVDEPAQALVAAAPERMLWGTDWPHVMKKKPMRNDGDMADLLERWVPDTATRQRILVDNPATLYGFEADEKIVA
jgi:predicted TIM-barrel fold metal-dependent hydrolase